MKAGEFTCDTEHAALDHEASPLAFEQISLPSAGAYLVEGANILAIQVFTDSHLAPVEWQHKPKRANG
jgi:hypothetical protein